jgi:membrane protein implicated in regulation of membrane protease activity
VNILHQFFSEVWKIWLVVSIAFMIGEGLTAGSFSLFFAGLGALVTALICYLYPSVAESLTQQLLFFSAISLLSLFLMRPRILSFIHRNKTKLDGPEAFLGKRAKALTNLHKDGIDTGKVLFEGTEWPAASYISQEIPAGSTVEIAQIEGLTLHVKLVETERI